MTPGTATHTQAGATRISRLRTAGTASIRWTLVSVRAAWLLLRVAVLVGSVALIVGMVRYELEPLAIVSGSMDPALPINSLIVDQRVPAASIERGDVITFTPPGEQTRITHRVVRRVERDGTWFFTTRGDANASNDVWASVSDDADEPVREISFPDGRVHKVMWDAPHLGRVAVLSATPNARRVIVFGVLALIALRLLFAIWRGPTTTPAPSGAAGQRRRRARRAGKVPAATLTMLLALSAVPLTMGMLSASASTSASLKGAHLSAPLASVQRSGQDVTISWAPASGLAPRGFLVERATSASGPYTQVAAPGAAARTYVDTPPPACGTYHYRVRATYRSLVSSSAVAGTVAADAIAPAVSRSIIVGRSDFGSLTGAVAPSTSTSGTFDVYAQVDELCATSGMVVTVDTANISGAATRTATSVGGPWTIDGASYSHRVAALATRSTLTGSSSTTWTIATTDGSNSATTAGQAPLVDAAAPVSQRTPAAVSEASNYFLPTGTGELRPGGAYRVYASFDATAAALRANVAGISAAGSGGGTGVELAAGLHSTDNGLTWGWRTATGAVTANPTATGTISFSVTAYDQLGNARAQSSSVTMDAVRPTATSCTSANGGSGGKLDSADTTTLTFSEAIDPGSLATNWAPTSLVDTFGTTFSASLVDGGPGNDDYVTFGSPLRLLPSVATSAGTAFSLGTSNWSTISFPTSTVSRAATNRFTITYAGSTSNAPTKGNGGTMALNSALQDPAGNVIASANVPCGTGF